MENVYPRSDLACESETYGHAPTKGTSYSSRSVGGITVSRLHVQTEEAAQRLGRARGRYVTFSCARVDTLSKPCADLLAHLLSGELRGMTQRLCKRRVDADLSVFVAGLGNAELTADAIGPQTVSRLTATRHLREHERGLFQSVGCCAISALAPGVLGQTGIETAELLRGAVQHVKPHVAVVVDALAARSCDRLAATVQLSDAGIFPGAGVGNHRSAITRETLGIPVLALGVPTVVDSSTLVYDALREAGIKEIGYPLREVLENGKRFFVSPKESDVICARVSELLARAISLAFAGELAVTE
ncbi:MAG: GPR endopeptidase [Clostridia bacterium]|nr:GPR endopeptidase [Clostridia bacterium]